jgi:hypothetical protein
MKNNYLYLIVSIVFFSACGEKIELSGGVPNFEVSVDKETFKVNEEVTFNFKGDAGIISFYSGEIGHDYNFKDGRIVEAGDVSLSFRTSQVIASGTQINQFSIWVLTDFNRDYSDFSNVQLSAKEDISDRLLLATGSAYRESGQANITDLIPKDDKPIYIGFKYVTLPQATNGTARQWFLQNLLVNSITSIGNITLADMSNAGFQIVDQSAGGLKSRSRIEATRLLLHGHEFNVNNDPQSENWIITKPIYGGSFDKGPDRPVAIKGNSEDRLSQYNYVYSQPGKYTVYFIASNTNINESKQVIRKVDITIEP